MKTSTYLLVLMSTVSFSVFAVEDIEQGKDQQLLASCQALAITSEQANDKSCIYFIKGFLATAQAINSSIINKQGNKLYKPYRTKGRISSTDFMPFCVPIDESDARVIKTVSKQLPPQIDTLKMLRDTIFKALKAEYPCAKA